MTAILLAAGIGKRMGTGVPPKCLLQVGGRTLLQRLMDSLRAAGVWEVVLVVGHEAEAVEAEARRSALDMELTVLRNPRYSEGAILSLWTARSHLDQEILVMDTDVLVPQAALERLLCSRRVNCILVDPNAAQSGEEQLVFGQDKRVHQITKTPSEELRRKMTCLGEAVGFLKLSREGGTRLQSLLDDKINAGICDIEHEQLYPDLFDQIEVGFESVDGLAWTEIDTPEDLKKAQEEVYPKWAVPETFNRVISLRFMPWVSKLPISPNIWTGISFFVGLIAVGAFAQGTYLSGLVGALLFQLFYIIDNWDGELARIRGEASWFGGWLDLTVDTVIQVALPLALAAGLIQQGAPGWVGWIGSIACLALLIDFGVTWWAKIRGFGPAVYSDPSRGQAQKQKPGWRGWLATNLSHENFSLLVLVAMVLNCRLLFLVLMAIGCQVFWIQYLVKERRRLFA